ncbi:hypothetical protein TNCV_1218621 [Trichonephila clavipes]|nr:hypothetical protein TNCV_1218621 [Trichonephila clavipes]
MQWHLFMASLLWNQDSRKSRLASHKFMTMTTRCEQGYQISDFVALDDKCDEKWYRHETIEKSLESALLEASMRLYTRPLKQRISQSSSEPADALTVIRQRDNLSEFLLLELF